jgi:hypothetical protein
MSRRPSGDEGRQRRSERLLALSVPLVATLGGPGLPLELGGLLWLRLVGD